MNGSINHPHYNTDKLDLQTSCLLDNNKLTGPTFIGQGLSHGVGSDCYGYYITGKKVIKNKTIWGISAACSEMHEHWAEGTMDCSIDMSKAKPQEWIIARGTIHYRGRDTGITKWWYCDENGKRFVPGKPARFSWNGAYAYRDPSF